MVLKIGKSTGAFDQAKETFMKILKNQMSDLLILKKKIKHATNSNTPYLFR
jgi:hypothetical protein